MFKSTLLNNANVKTSCFKPYKGNVQIADALYASYPKVGFKPYKGNVQMSLTKRYF